MTIMLAIIATNLISISNSLKQEAKISSYKEICARSYAYGNGLKEPLKSILVKKARLKNGNPNLFCQGLETWF